MKCHGVNIACRIQLESSSDTHECKQSGKCIFAPSAPDEPKVHCHVCPTPPEEYCEINCLDVITRGDTHTYDDGTTAIGPSPLPAISPRTQDLLEQALHFAEEVWHGKLNKDAREGAAFNLMSNVREYLQALKPAAPPLNPPEESMQ